MWKLLLSRSAGEHLILKVMCTNTRKKKKLLTEDIAESTKRTIPSPDTSAVLNMAHLQIALQEK